MLLTACKDKDQISYIQTRQDDIDEISKGSIYNDIKFTDKLRIFSGDGPARQFEGGQQRGGNFSCLCGIPTKDHINLETCFKVNPMDLEDRRKKVVNGVCWQKLKTPFRT